MPRYWGEAGRDRLARERLEATARGRHVIPMTNRAVRHFFPNEKADDIRARLRAKKWKPSAQWLATTGARYGRLLVMSDMHVGAGYNPVTGAFANSDDFTASHEEDFHHLLRRQWAAAEGVEGEPGDGKVRTLVFNGDIFEFMQTERVAVGELLDEHADEFGPLNTPINLARKLDAIYEGHWREGCDGFKSFFNAWAEHLARGHRIVLNPGNHDHQLLNPVIRGRLIERLTASVAKELISLNRGSTETAPAEAVKIMRERFEFHPWFFIHGDLMARHGHETDSFNNFRRPFSEYYRPTPDTHELPGAAGDAVVKALFNRTEALSPWADNTANKSALCRAMLGSAWWVSRPSTNSTIIAALLCPGTLLKALSILRRGLCYVLTRDGQADTDEEIARERAELADDIAKYVLEFDLRAAFNQLQPADRQFTHAQLVAELLAYETEVTARPFSSFFRRSQGFMRRLLIGVRNLSKIRGAMDVAAHRKSVTAYLHSALSVRYTYGHDHLPRIDKSLVIRDGEVVQMLDSLDTDTWINADPTAMTRSVGLVSCERRTVLVVDFDKHGSHARLMRFDAGRAYAGNEGLQRITVLEDTASAMFR